MPLATAASTPIFLKEMMAEVNEQRHDEPSNTDLYVKFAGKVNELRPTLIACHKNGATREDVVQVLIEVAALSLRLAAEGDPAVKAYRWPYA